MPHLREYHLRLPQLSSHATRMAQIILAVRIIRDLITKLTLFFIPIFLFLVGETLSFPWYDFSSFQMGMMTVAVYYLISHLVSLGTALPLARIFQTIGSSRGMVLGHLSLGLLLVVLAQVERWPLLIVLAAIINGLHYTLFWSPIYTLTRHTTQELVDNSPQASSQNLVQFIVQLGMVMAPALGGIIALHLGFDILFLSTLILVLVGVFLALILPPVTFKGTVSWRGFTSLFKLSAFKPLVTSSASQYFNDAIMALWPLQVLALLGTVDRVGFIFSITLFLSFMITFFFNIYFYRHRSPQATVVSGTVLSGLWLLRVGIAQVWSIVLVDTLEKLAANFHWHAIESLALKKNLKHSNFVFLVYRELLMSASALLFWSAFFIFIALVNTHWQGLFIIGAMTVLLSLTLKRSQP